MADLKTLIAGDKPVLAPVVFNPIMAKLAEAAGFPALYLGGGTLGYVKTELEANLTLTETTQLGLEIRAACPLPLILDGACGFGDPMHQHRTVRTAEAAGFAAIEIEDQILPKRAHHHVGIEHLVPQDLMVHKIAEVVAARRSRDFLVIARTNGIRSSDMDDALRRGAAYKKAGADLLMLAPRTPEEFRRVAENLEPPFQYNMPRGGLGRLGMSVADVYDLGCRILIDPTTPFLAAYKAWKEVYACGPDLMVNPPVTAEDVEAQMFADIGLPAMLDVEKRTVEK